MIVAGVMSGTSADGINVAIVRILGKGFNTRFSLLAHHQVAYEPAVRAKILSLMNAKKASVAELARLNFLLGDLYAEAILETQCKNSIVKLDLIGCHGQTLYHQGEASKFLSSKTREARWGKLPIAAIFRALQTIRFPGFVNLEYEINPKDPLPGMQVSFAYMRGILAGMA